MIALPADVKRLAPERASSATGAIAACGSAAQVLGLMAVYYSDTCTFRYGRRRPFLVLGALLTVLGGCAWIVGSAVELLAFVALGYVIMFVGVAIGNSIIPTLFTDLLPQSQHGMANGIMGLENLIGSALGFGLFGVGVDTWVCLIIFVAISAVLLLPTLIFSHETQYMPPPRPKESHSHWTACKDGCTSFAFSWREHPDFVLVLLVRVLYYVCTGAATYMQYWAGDVLQTDNAEQVVGQLGVVTLITAVLIAVPTGALSDRFGRRPFAACGLLFLAAGVCSWAAVQSLPGVWISVCIFGLGNGLYPSVETAQACDCLPSNRDSGRFLGEFALAATLGQLVGQFGVGLLLQQFAIPHGSGSAASSSSLSPFTSSGSYEEMYEHTGYLAAFLACGMLCFVGCVLALFINTLRGKAAQVRRDALQDDRMALCSVNAHSTEAEVGKVDKN
eukprot:TRINITY_DN2012_c0_g1_i1.p1 TRINITY_DN2012_c0_g1~~TRINITY_DN2012_c0_g1_i1.p1  ORF type:complete len:447 (-),score=116.10 TRINITY_DN2012_c0_g1_i1:85-1425(-)